MKTRIFSGALVVFTAILLCLGQDAMAQGVISLPWTGQSKCYDESGGEISCAGTRQDGEVQAGVDWPNPRFTVSGDCVTDHLTGLKWSKNANLANKKMSWSAALDYVASINSGSGLCGYKDWHFPNINELESLVNAGEANAATWLASQGFSNVKADYYWSSTTFLWEEEAAWAVNMQDGIIDMYTPPFNPPPIHLKGNSYYAWPVREDSTVGEAPARVWKTGQTHMYHPGDDGDLRKGVAWPSPRFTDHGDGTVTDNLTGLMWSKEADVTYGATTWPQALDSAKGLKTAKYSDWRLPNRKELLSLFDRSAYNPGLPGELRLVFDNVHYEAKGVGCYWSSTTNASHAANVWLGMMWAGAMWGAYTKFSSCFVWPVRSAQAASPNPVISVSPNPVQFGTVIVGATLDKSVTVKNAGGANLVIGAITSPSSPFDKTTDNCSGQTLPAGATCDVTYRFAPGSATTFNSNSNIPSNDPDKSTATVTLTGTGTDASPAISVNPTAYDFGEVKVKKSKTTSFVVKNGGKTNLSVSSAVTGTDASMFPITSGSGNKTIKPGKTLTLKVGFKPTSKGSQSATLRITSDDPVAPTLDIPLSGTGQ